MPGREAAAERALGPDRVSHVLHVAGEAVANAVRHADATTISVGCRWTRRRFVLEVHDDGKGLSDGAGDRGSGLRNMVARAGIIGGTLNLGSRPGDGTVVHLEIPLSAMPA
jgi:signal transduction histidine kinase